jgi:hypothetical protein
MADDFDPYYTWLGIPPKDQPPNHYRLLGLELFESNPDVIENAADRQMAHVRTVGSARHQDISQRVLNEIATARLCLLNVEKKAAYDAELQAKIAPPPATVQRAVRRATPLTGPALSDGGLGVRPLYTPSEPPPAGPPPGIELGYSLAPQAPRSIPVRSRQRPPLIALIAGGAAIGLATVFGVWYALRSDTSPRDPVAQGTTGPRPQAVPQGIDGPEKTIDSPAKSPPELKASPEKTLSEPKTDQPVQAPKKLPKTEPSETPAAQQALRLLARDHIEVTGTKDLDLQEGRAFLTAEMWVRINPTKSRVALMGNVAAPRVHPDVAAGIAPGWVLSHARGVRTGDGAEKHGLFLQAGGRFYVGVDSEMDDAWHHVAVCIEDGRPSTAFRVYLDGRKVLAVGVPTDSYRKSPSDFYVGSPRYLPQAATSQTDALVRGFRLSSSARYTESFSPGEKLASDERSLACLDFSRGQGETLADSSGHGRTGRIVGAQWARDEAPLAGESKPAASPEFAVNVTDLPRYAMRFAEQDRVELSNTKDLLELLQAYTVEMWVKPTDKRAAQSIVGNFVVGSLHPDVGRGNYQGWLLSQIPIADGRLGIVVLRGAQGTGGHVPGSLAGQWVHMAVCFDGEREVVFFNGKRLSSKKAPLPSASLSPLCLGVPPYGGQADRIRFDGEICGLRISKGARYAAAFTPSPTFDPDADALVVLDFARPNPERIRDMSGKNYHGRITGARWIETRTGNVLNLPKTPPQDDTQK